MPKFAVIDADGHVQEPEEAWAKHLEPAFRPFAPRTLLDD